jgi:hypothetical protein
MRLEINLSPLEALALSRCAFRQDWGGHLRDVTDETEIQNALFLIELAQAASEGIFDKEADARAERVSLELINAYRSAKAKIEGRESPEPIEPIARPQTDAEKRQTETPEQTRARRIRETEADEREFNNLLAARGLRV